MAETLRFTVIGHGDAEGIERLAHSIDDLVERLRRLDRTDAVADVDVETRRAERKVGAFARNLRRQIREAIAALPSIELDADASEAQREIAQIRAELIALRDGNIGIDLDAGSAQSQMLALQARLAEIAGDSASVQVSADAAAAMAALGAVERQANRLDGRNIRLHVTTIGVAAAISGLARFGNQIRGVGVALAAITAVGALPEIVGIGSAAVQASGALALLPAAAVTAAAGIGTLVLGFQNLGDALGETDTPAQIKKVERAVAKLSPNARELVGVLRELSATGGFRSMQLDVQDRLLQGVGQSVKNLATAHLPGLRSMLVGTAAGFNEAFLSSSAFLSTEPTVQKMSGAMDLVRQALVNAAGSARPLTEAFVSLVSVGATRMPMLGQAITNVATRFRDWVVQAERSGDLIRIIDRAISAIQQMGRIAVNIGSTFGGLFRAADEAGVSFLGTVERITSSIRTFVNSAQGQAAIVGFFRSLSQTVDAVLPGLQAIGRAIVDLFSQLSSSGVLVGLGQTFTSIAQAAAPLLGVLGGLASVVLPPLLAVFRALAPVLVPVAAGLLAVSLAARGLLVLTTLGAALAGFVTRIGAAGTAAAGFRVAMTGMAGFLGAGGPWGLAIAAAIVGIGLLVSAFQRGEQAAQEQKAAIDGLRGTLDQLTGAVTQQTVAQKAQELSTKQLGETGKTYLQAVKSLGISTADYTQASLGNAEALGRVKTQLDTHVKGLIAATPAYQSSQRELANLGLSLDDLAAAAQGNGPAMDKVNSALDRAGGGSIEANQQLRALVGGFLAAGGSAAELARALGISNGQLEAAQQQVRDAAEAGAALATEFGAVKAAFDAVPDQKTVTVQSLSEPAQAALTALGLTVETIPGSKEVRITAPTAEAKANFDAFVAGVQNTTADVMIGGNPTPAQDAFNAILGAIEAGAAEVDINGNPMPASAALSFALGLINSSTGTVMIDGQPTPVQTVLSSVIAAITAGKGEVTIDGKTAPVNDALAAVVAAVTGANPTLTIVPSTDQVDAAKTNAATPTQSPHEVGSPTTDNTTGPKGTASAPTQNPHTVGSPTTDNTAGPKGVAQGATANPHTVGSPTDTGPVDGAKTAAEQPTRSLHTLDADDNAVRDAKSRAEQPTRSLHTIDCNDNAVRDAKAAAQRSTSSTHTIHVRVIGGPPRAIGAYTQPREFGAYASPRAEGAYATPYAAGGMRRMSGARAELVPPKQPRIIGDRQVHDEAFIPVNNSVRSHAILRTTASQMGYELVPVNGSAATWAMAGNVGSSSASVDFGGSTRGGDGGELLAEVRQLNANLRTLRGDVDHHGDNLAIVQELRALRSVLATRARGGSAAANAQNARTTAELGAF